jgi:DNA-binding LacI/PurR family transcriptional regulator
MADAEATKPLRKTRVTRDDVARHAQVSTAVVSYVINNGPRAVSPETRQRVEQAIAELGYFPNTIARSLRSDHSYTIGLIVPHLSDPFYAEIAGHFQSSCNQAGYLVLLYSSERIAQNEEKAIGELRNHQADGVVLIPTQDSPALLRPLLFAGVPTVVLDRHLPNAHSITVDDLEGGRLAIQHLLNLGHRRIGIILQDIERTTGSERLLGYCQALAGGHIAYDDTLIIPSAGDGEAAYEATLRLLSQPRPPTALFADNDRISLSVMRAVYAAGLRIPDDISIVGYCTSALAGSFAPPLTTVVPYPYSLGTMAAETILRLITQRDHASASAAILPMALLVRASTAPPKQAHGRATT